MECSRAYHTYPLNVPSTRSKTINLHSRVYSAWNHFLSKCLCIMLPTTTIGGMKLTEARKTHTHTLTRTPKCLLPVSSSTGTQKPTFTCLEDVVSKIDHEDSKAYTIGKEGWWWSHVVVVIFGFYDRRSPTEITPCVSWSRIVDTVFVTFPLNKLFRQI